MSKLSELGLAHSWGSVASPSAPVGLLAPVSLDSFVKPLRSEDTEKMVRKEYEIVGLQGEVLRGRRAREALRRPNVVVVDDDGFELI